MTEGKSFEIRKFHPNDRARVRELCCATGFLGKAIDPVFEDRQLFADYLTAYYTDWEPEGAFVVLLDGETSRYLLDSPQPFRQQLYNPHNNFALFLRGLFRYRHYNAASKKL